MDYSEAEQNDILTFLDTLAGWPIVMLYCFVKKSEKTPRREREIAEVRTKEVKRADT